MNFNDLLLYGGQPPVQNKYASPLPCKGYCVSCEKKYGIALDLMSHGCDSSDFEKAIGKPMLAVSGRSDIDRPIMFLLERAKVGWLGIVPPPVGGH